MRDEFRNIKSVLLIYLRFYATNCRLLSKNVRKIQTAYRDKRDKQFFFGIQVGLRD